MSLKARQPPLFHNKNKGLYYVVTKERVEETTAIHSYYLAQKSKTATVLNYTFYVWRQQKLEASIIPELIEVYKTRTQQSAQGTLNYFVILLEEISELPEDVRLRESILQFPTPTPILVL